jgi:four helix bundle protein
VNEGAQITEDRGQKTETSGQLSIIPATTTAENPQMRIEHFTELNVYQSAFSLARDLFVISKRWPTEERYSLTDQVRRAARSVGANIAESWGKRRYEAHFISKLSDADTENHEVEHWLMTALGDGYITQTEYENLVGQKKAIGRMLGSMIQNPKPFLLT